MWDWADYLDGRLSIVTSSVDEYEAFKKFVLEYNMEEFVAGMQKGRAEYTHADMGNVTAFVVVRGEPRFAANKRWLVANKYVIDETSAHEFIEGFNDYKDDFVADAPDDIDVTALFEV